MGKRGRGAMAVTHVDSSSESESPPPPAQEKKRMMSTTSLTSATRNSNFSATDLPHTYSGTPLSTSHDEHNTDVASQAQPTSSEKKIPNNIPIAVVVIPEGMRKHLMTPENKQTLLEATGCTVQWNTREGKVLVTGANDAGIKKCQKVLGRVLSHCKWGVNEDKVQQLLKPRPAESVMCKLTPTCRKLPGGSKSLSGVVHSPQTRLTIGKNTSCDLVIPDRSISRMHAMLEFDPEVGGLYIIDYSTNGTFLNGVQVPPKKSGKVFVSHGDEISLRDPNGGDNEFGYIVNLDIRGLKSLQRFDAPRRLLSFEEAARKTVS